MTERHDRDIDESGRRMTTVFYLAFAVMLTAALAVLPMVADTYRLSGLWVTFCAAIGIN
ncbi:hypothetical protein T8K17_01475 [Thalassobaculum sp. OXR-137]|uniref:hypothetical protein n=1 Tax=Thalassobaculum sp. OXR-137 TaxID=3100173 RepID=UPI002AC92E8A|nr:hypothetical protein [Thalassobaculum sp. OXR-137]WPZ34819.1 hypothetical protein T8K17_01475 [Thalassobaculum sp. OXR-137]